MIYFKRIKLLKKNVLYICFFIYLVDISKNKLFFFKYDNNNI